MGQLVSRILMWAIIVGLVWYLSLQYRSHTPDANQAAAMRAAAQHYQQQKAMLQPDSDLPPPVNE